MRPASEADAAVQPPRLSARQAEIQRANRAYVASHGLAWTDDDPPGGASGGIEPEQVAGTAWRRLDVTLRSVRHV
jgi:hypothetical protein